MKDSPKKIDKKKCLDKRVSTKKLSTEKVRQKIVVDKNKRRLLSTENIKTKILDLCLFAPLPKSPMDYQVTH